MFFFLLLCLIPSHRLHTHFIPSGSCSGVSFSFSVAPISQDFALKVVRDSDGLAIFEYPLVFEGQYLEVRCRSFPLLLMPFTRKTYFLSLLILFAYLCHLLCAQITLTVISCVGRSAGFLHFLQGHHRVKSLVSIFNSSVRNLFCCLSFRSRSPFFFLSGNFRILCSPELFFFAMLPVRSPISSSILVVGISSV